MEISSLVDVAYFILEGLFKLIHMPSNLETLLALPVVCTVYLEAS